jgi:predicted acylesterase/phospholipase RssA
VVLGAGAFRGLAHIGVLKALRKASLPIDSIIGCSIGGLVAAFHAGLGLDLDEIAEKMSRLTTPSLFSLGIALRRWGALSLQARRRVDTLLEELGRLETLDLGRLHFGVRRLGLLAMDLPRGTEIFTATGMPCPVAADHVVLGGISIPMLFPLVRVAAQGRIYRLADGGFSHAVPVERAFESPFRARSVLAVDLQVIRGFRERERNRWTVLHARHGEALVRLTPEVSGVGTIFFRQRQAADLVRAGEESVTDAILSRLTLAGSDASVAFLKSP